MQGISYLAFPRPLVVCLAGSIGMSAPPSQAVEIFDRPPDDTLREVINTYGISAVGQVVASGLQYRDAGLLRPVGLDPFLSLRGGIEIYRTWRLEAGYQAAILTNGPVYLGAGAAGSLVDTNAMVPVPLGIAGVRLKYRDLVYGLELQADASPRVLGGSMFLGFQL